MMNRLRRCCHPSVAVRIGLGAVVAAIALSAVLVAGCAGSGAGGGKGAGAASAKSDAKTLYHCPMHPEYVSDKPGDCPICGMRLVPFEPKGGGRGAGATPSAAAVTSPPSPVRDESLPPSSIDLGADRARLAGVRVVAAKGGRVSRSIRATGTVAIDETRVRQVTTKLVGFVEKLFVNTTGQVVKVGEPLFELYSPELLASQEEYLRARRSAAEFAKSALPEVRRGGEELAVAARRRLELFDVPSAFLERLDRSGTVERTIVFTAPFAGFVTGKRVTEGQRIEPGMELLTVTDMSSVWVMVQVYEAEAQAAQVGRGVKVTLPYDERVTLNGRIGFVYPTLDTDTRTLKVRAEFPNPTGVLKPGMFVTVDLGVDEASGIVIPDSAVLDTGARQVVFVELSPGRFATREVTVALRADGLAVVRKGLSAGEQVAVSANFLLDSETRLRNAARVSAQQHQDH